MASDMKREWNEFGWMGALSRETGLPVTFAALQSIAKELPWQEQMSSMAEENAKGANIHAQISLRGTGILMAWRGTVHPFKFKPSWVAIGPLDHPHHFLRAKSVGRNDLLTGVRFRLVTPELDTPFSRTPTNPQASRHQIAKQTTRFRQLEKTTYPSIIFPGFKSPWGSKAFLMAW
jgi:hypothetical protein